MDMTQIAGLKFACGGGGGGPQQIDVFRHDRQWFLHSFKFNSYMPNIYY